RLEAAGVRVLRDPRGGGRVRVDWAVAALWRAGLWSLMVEGGSEVLGSFLRAGLFDQVALFRAPLLLGGRGALSALGGPDPGRLAEAHRLRPVSSLLRRYERARRSGPLAELWYPEA